MQVEAKGHAACDLCACPAETPAHIQCVCSAVCPALKGPRIAAHHSDHTLAGMVFNTVRDAGEGWDVHGELTVAGLQGNPVPANIMPDWYRLFDYLTGGDLMTDTAAELENGRTDGLCALEPA